MTRALALALLLLAPSPVRADPESDVGIGPRAAALGGAVSAIGGDPWAAAYNPGALVTRGDAPGFGQLSVATLNVFPVLSTRSLAPDRELAIEAPPPTYALAIGGRFDVGRPIGLPGLALGLSIYAPLEGLVRSNIRPDDTPSWLLEGDRLSHIVIHAGLAYRIVEWLSIGVGVRITFDEEAFITGTALDVRRVTDPETGEERVEAGTRLGIDSGIYGRAGPSVGVLVSPLEELRFAFAWRGRVFSDDWGWSRLQGIEGVGDIGFVHRFTHVFRPDELALSAAYRPHPVIEVSAELTWQLWSQALSPNFSRLAGRFGDVWVPAAGVRLTPIPGIDVMLGYRYARRPYDDFGGPTNLLANDRHQVGLGVELDVSSLLPEESIPLTLSLAGRLSILEDREEVKDGRRFDSDRALLTNPGYPGYRHGGLVPSVQLSLETRW